ncbi:hypothetical protein SAMN05216490_3858 [Mucilaginibacter mallensis]|uniref:Dolichyl-phosphate-mannose-protein mannosyltransferase n=1 Tax=Mucilaginibacter mallensis TaxID=652787 RepID=A0A1H2B2B6_MUCMA|nr:hypothetical protein [Mucilaginibacter mallensis]SDT52139.1 hypothetical protein SAMN05216490_3858 [Mucilaginibacter mallensis]
MQFLSFYSNKNRFYYLFVASVTALSMYPILFNGFWRFSDDEWILLNNPQVFTLDGKIILQYFTSYTEGQYAPINTLIYATVYHFFRLTPFWYHLISFFFHLANTLLVFRFVLGLLRLHHGESRELHKFIAIFTAIAFGIHPMQVETIVWVAASKTVICSFFILLSLSMYVKWLNEKSLFFYLLAFLFFIISFGVKEQGVIIPVCLLLIDYLAGRKLIAKKLIVEKIPFIITALFCGIISLQGQVIYAGPDFFKSKYYPLWERLIFSCYSLTLYITKITLPLSLSPYYPFPVAPEKHVPIWLYIFPVLIVILVCFLFFLIIKKKRLVVFCITFFVLNLILMLHIIPLARFGMMADRYIYISIVGYFMLLGSFLSKASWFQKQPNRLGAIIMIYFLTLGVYANTRARNWDAIVSETEAQLSIFWKKGGFH